MSPDPGHNQLLPLDVDETQLGGVRQRQALRGAHDGQLDQLEGHIVELGEQADKVCMHRVGCNVERIGEIGDEFANRRRAVEKLPDDRADRVQLVNFAALRVEHDSLTIDRHRLHIWPDDRCKSIVERWRCGHEASVEAGRAVSAAQRDRCKSSRRPVLSSDGRPASRRAATYRRSGRIIPRRYATRAPRLIGAMTPDNKVRVLEPPSLA